MIIYPAIDIKNGEVVRLQEGDPNQKTVYGNSPVAVAERWHAAGAEWIHIINLDGAFNETAQLEQTLAAIAKLGLKIQFGGGLRSHEAVELALANGVSRAIIGTAAVKNPDFAGELVQKHDPEKIVIALDARDGMVATHGWQEKSDWTAIDLGKELVARGVSHALYTDISRDGMLIGVNAEATEKLAKETGLQIVASGGVRSIEDVHAVKGRQIAGIILGKALYEGLIDLREAIRLAN